MREPVLQRRGLAAGPLWFANRIMAGGQPSATAWAAVQTGLNALLISPAAKRRAGIELRPRGVDADAEAAVAQVARYQEQLQPLRSV